MSSDGLSYRSSEVWTNQATLVLTQEGAPELRSVLPSASLADTDRFARLIDVYATLATSDPVMRILQRRGLLKQVDLEAGENPISAAALVSPVGGGTTPLMTITASAKSGAEATKLTLGATDAFVSYVRERQIAAKIPPRNRIQLRVVKNSGVPTLVEPRSKAIPILVFLGGLIATASIAFTRENAARRGRPVVSASTLGPVHDLDAVTVRERELPDEVAKPAQQTGSQGRWASSR